MKDEKISLSFVNKGKEFSLPKMTVERHQEYLIKLKDIEEKYKDEQKKDIEANIALVLETLKMIDDNVSMDDIKKMHPQDLAELSIMIFNAGRELGGDKGFRKTK